MSQNRTTKRLALLGMVIIAIFFSVMPTVNILGIDLIPVRIPPQVIEVETETGIIQFDIPTLDLRQHPVNHFDVEQWFLGRLNSHRASASLPLFQLDALATVASIEHSIYMRDHPTIDAFSFDSRTESERICSWIDNDRKKSVVVLAYTVLEELCFAIVEQIVDHLFVDAERASFLQNPDYHYIGIGTSIDKDGVGTLSITLIGEN